MLVLDLQMDYHWLLFSSSQNWLGHMHESGGLADFMTCSHRHENSKSELGMCAAVVDLMNV